MDKSLSDAEYYSSLPKKHIGAGVLIFDESGRLLIVKPNYKEGWSIPGGAVDDNETPKRTALRETKEEIGLDLHDVSLVCVQYTSPQGIKPETIQFAFYGGILDSAGIASIHLDTDEHSEFKFVEVSEAIDLLEDRVKSRLPSCLEGIKNKTVAYIES